MGWVQLHRFAHAYLRRALGGGAILFAALIPAAATPAADDDSVDPVATYSATIEPLLSNYCFDCHSNGADEGGVAFDAFASEQSIVADKHFWHRVLKQVRAGLMPPAGEVAPTENERQTLVAWIKQAVFQGDSKYADPGTITLRRLNRVEYRNTIHDLLDVDYDTSVEFPPDDTGHGFDNIASVLTLSPLMLEKYISAAKHIVDSVVPQSPRVIPERLIPGSSFDDANPTERDTELGAVDSAGSLALSYYEQRSVTASFDIEHDGEYQLVVHLRADERYVDGVFDYNKCRLVMANDGEELLDEEFTRQGGQAYEFTFNRSLSGGKHEIAFTMHPLTSEEKLRDLTLHLVDVTLRGPTVEKNWIKPERYDEFFPRPTPTTQPERREYARELIEDFAGRAFRRPVDEPSVHKLIDIAIAVSQDTGGTFEAGIAQAMVAILASPRFLFREEVVCDVPSSNEQHPLIDEYALASRLSYFLWSSMPDEELYRLAEQGQLRAQLDGQLDRMLADHRSHELIRNFVGQWLRTRDMESLDINSLAVLARDQGLDTKLKQNRKRFRKLRSKAKLTKGEKAELKEIRAEFTAMFPHLDEYNLDDKLRRAMRRETEMQFEYILDEDRNLVELLDADYTFLNQRLAKHYGIEDVVGDEMRLVSLPADSPRGGVLTQGTILTVTSNPDRTSPVKRGLFVLDNLLGMPPAPPPANVPPLEAAADAKQRESMTLRDILALHRKDTLCSSCHNRMDPLGLALEHFNALGMWREQDNGQDIESAGSLITGELFRDTQEFKTILATGRRLDFYRCVTEKMMIYALGRGLDYYDVDAVDRIVANLVATDGKPSTLIRGIVESVPFQRRRRTVD